MRTTIDLKRISVICITGLIGVLIIYIIFSTQQFAEHSLEQQTANIVEIIRKAAVQCYALEGEYPPNLDYLVGKYGVVLDENRFFYHYDVSLGSNYMPDIIVTTK